MRVLIAGIIGGAASAAAWFFLEYATGHEMGWLAILVGIVTGLCVNAAAGASAGESYGRGALAVLITMIAMVGGRAVYAAVMQNVSQVSVLAPAAQPADEVADAPAEENADDAAAVADEEEPAAADTRSRTTSAASAVRITRPTVNNYKEMEVVWMAAAALAAYFTGKGSGKHAPTTVEADAAHEPEGTAGTPA